MVKVSKPLQSAVFGGFKKSSTQKNRRNGEVGGGTLYLEVFVVKTRGTHYAWNSYTTVQVHVIPASVHLYTCAAVCTALYSYLAPALPQFCQRNLSRLHQTPNPKHQTPNTRHQKRVIEVGVPPPKNSTIYIFTTYPTNPFLPWLNLYK